MAEVIFTKMYSAFISKANTLSKSELLAFLWFTIHADSRGNMVVLEPELFERLLKYVGVKRTSMYNTITKLQKKGLIAKHGDIVLVNSVYANKHRKLSLELTPYNWSLTKLDY